MNSQQPRPDDPWLEDEDDEPQLRPWWKNRRIWWLAIVVIALLIFIFSQGHAPSTPEATKNPQPIAVVQPYVPVAAPAKAAPEPPPSPPTAAPAPSPPPINLIPPKPTNLAGAPSGTPGMLSYAVAPPPPAPSQKPADTGEPTHTGIKFAAATLPGAKASPAIDDTYVLYPGLLPIVLDTAIDSNLPGPILGHLPGPIYSRKGVLLLEAETQIIGKYESMKQNGVNRLEAVSTFAFTPNGIWVPLSGQPVADDLGRTGVHGTLDRRLFERFGGAVLLDLAGTGLQIVQANVAKGGNTYLSFNSSDQLASQILQSTINLPPIMTKNPGSLIALWITEPIDFSDSYRLKAAGYDAR